MESIRLDLLVTEKGIARSREAAKRLIEEGKVTVDGKTVNKPSKLVSPSSIIDAQEEKYVSRGAYKLEKALDTFNIDVDDKCFIDCGASTGGFTDILLQRGAKHVWAVDVGTMQLVDKLKNDHRVTSIENTNLRYIESCDWMQNINGAVIDVSFISLTLILPRLFEVLPQDSFYVALVKPQFEAGRASLNKHGIVKDKKDHILVLEKLSAFLIQNSYSIHGLTFSPVKGGDGNAEYLIYFSRSKEGIPQPLSDKIISDTVQSALKLS